jgi:hypothetical protein
MTAACTIEGESDDDGRSPRPGVPVYTYNALFNAADGRFPDPDGNGPLESITGTAKTGQKISSLGAERGGWGFSAWTSPTKNDETAVFKDGEVFTKSALDSLRPDDEGVITFTAVWNPEDTSIEIGKPDKPWEGGFQEVTINETGTYRIELWGAQGGFADYSSTKMNGGKGGYTKGEIDLPAGTKLYVYIGGTRVRGLQNSQTGGFNGGGSGSSTQPGGSGGGATDVRTVQAPAGADPSANAASLASRIMVAAGGGGANVQGSVTTTYSHTGGYAGGLTGQSGIGDGAGTGGGQSTGGTSSSSDCGGAPGVFGKGGSYSASATNESVGGGGGGWFGGAGGSHKDGNSSGAGGSSYISGHDGCIGTSSPHGFTANGGSGVEKSKSYTGLFFTNTEIKAGNEMILKPNGSATETGHEGPGAAKITKLTQ